MKLFKKIIRYGCSGILSGIAIGFVIALCCNLIDQTNYFMPSNPPFLHRFSSVTLATLISTILWAMMGFLGGASALIFMQEKWSITKQTVIHFIVTFCLFTPLAILAGWFPLNFLWLSLYTLVFVIVYAIIWYTSMLKAKKQISKINRAIKENN
ncbi:DUF3021 domain-containing protein [Lactobacillus sp. ESL0703]|uniref:DUF3021 domain-containing protein n=1 Tax=Lactobacillus sp. ESL0703 TaxID=2983218 RepID=UPI0023F6ACBF|nr:DUF3021 domain-containing protein [Lactobacillus sp. ESL0703]MDF7669157.1 DUF3021 domain-containing protein [Lactobacillus sp. ESL0703]